MKSLSEYVDEVRSKEHLVQFLQLLANDLVENPERWENDTLDRYLQALASWIEDSDGYYANRGESPPVTPSWKNIADMLIAAKMYE